MVFVSSHLGGQVLSVSARTLLSAAARSNTGLK